MSGNKMTFLAAAVSLVLLGAGCVPKPVDPVNAPTGGKPRVLVSYYFVALSDSPAFREEKTAEVFGCNDKLAMVKEVTIAEDSVLEVAMNRLLSATEAEVTELGLYSPLVGQGLRAEVTPEGATTVMNIIGELRSGGVCDDPRIRNMIEESAKINNNDVLPEVRLNGSASAWRCFGDMSGRCE